MIVRMAHDNSNNSTKNNQQQQEQSRTEQGRQLVRWSSHEDEGTHSSSKGRPKQMIMTRTKKGNEGQLQLSLARRRSWSREEEGSCDLA